MIIILLDDDPDHPVDKADQKRSDQQREKMVDGHSPENHALNSKSGHQVGQ